MTAISLEQAGALASLFDIPAPVKASEFSGRGNINQQTFLIHSGPDHDRSECLLQLLNPQVFKHPLSVMEAMVACIKAQQEALSKGILRKDEEWEPVTLVPTKKGPLYLESSDKAGTQCWRMMRRIPHTRSYRSLSEIADRHEQLRIAEEAGKGLALFGALTSAMNPSQIGCPLAGYRDTRIYYDQLHSVLAGNRTVSRARAWLPADPTVRQSTEQYFLVHLSPDVFRRRVEDPELRPFIALAAGQKSFALTLQRELIAGKLRKVVVHGDTKLDNFLFSTETGMVKALVDLDTVMPHTWLSDWGDMVRSLVNVTGEREQDLSKIKVDLDIFKALARGFLSSARDLALHEIQLMADAAQIMALELGVRFLADYLRGDTYFRLTAADPPELNKVRALVQFTVFENLRQNANFMKLYTEEMGAAKS
jgi:N-acetylhexosamine 1-kinase